MPFSEWTQGPLPDRPLPGMLKAGLSGFYRELPYAARSMASGVDPACAPPTRLRGSAQRTESNTRVTPSGRRRKLSACRKRQFCEASRRAGISAARDEFGQWAIEPCEFAPVESTRSDFPV